MKLFEKLFGRKGSKEGTDARGAKRDMKKAIEPVKLDSQIVRETTATSCEETEAQELSRLIDDLKGQHTGTRWQAVEALDKRHWIPTDVAQRVRYLIVKQDWKMMKNVANIGKLFPYDLISADIKEGHRLHEELVGLGKDAVDALIEILGDKDPFIACIAARALGRIGDGKAVDSLIQALEDNNADIRGEAALALGMIRDVKAVNPLIQCLKEKDGGVAWRATRALKDINDARAVDPLIQTLTHEDWAPREGAAQALGRTADIRAVLPLIQALHDKVWNVRAAAATALGETNDVRALEPLAEASNDEHYEVRKAAQAALNKINANKSDG